MGFTDNRFINKLAVSPGAIGNLPGSGRGKAFTFIANIFSEQANKARADDIAADKERGTVLGANSIEIDSLGNISRKAMPPEITSPEGQRAFRIQQRSNALSVRQNAIRNKSAELYVKYKNNPDSLKKYEDDMRAFLTPFFDGTDKDIAGVIQYEAEDTIRKAVTQLGQIIEDKDFVVRVAQQKQNVSAILSNIQEAEYNGNGSNMYLTQLGAILSFGLEAGTTTQAEYDAHLKTAHISRITGQLFRKVSAKTENLAETVMQIRKDLFKSETYSFTDDDEEGVTFDITGADRNRIMQQLMGQVNFIYQNVAQQKNQENELYSKMLDPISEKAAKGEIKSQDQLDDLMNEAGLTEDIKKSSTFVRGRYVVLLNKVTGVHNQMARLQERKVIADFNVSLMTAKTDKEFTKIWNDIHEAQIAGTFIHHPEAETTLMTRQATRLKAIATQRKIDTDQGWDDFFTQKAFSGELNDEVLAWLMGRGGLEGDEPNRSMVTYLQNNHNKVRGWMTAQDGGQTEFKEILTAMSRGLSPDANGRRVLDKYIENRTSAAERDNNPNPFDFSTEEGKQNLIALTMKHQVASTPFNTWISNLAFSNNASEAKEAVNIYRGLTNVGAPAGKMVLASLPGKIASRLDALSSGARSAVEDQKDFNVWNMAHSLNSPTGMDRVKARIAQTTPDAFQAVVREHISEASGSENSESRAGLWTLGAWTVFRNFFPSYKSATEKMLRLNYKNEEAWFNWDLEPFSAAVTDILLKDYSWIRLKYPDGEGGDKLAVHETMARAWQDRLIGPTPWKPRRLIDPSTNEYVEENEDLLYYGVRPLNAYFVDFPNGAGIADSLVEHHVRYMLSEVPSAKVQNFPYVMRSWLGRTAGSVATLGNDWLQEAFGWTDMMEDGWIRIEPDLNRSTKDQWVGRIILQDPTDPTKPPFILDEHYAPNIQLYHAIQNARFKAQEKGGKAQDLAGIAAYAEAITKTRSLLK